MNQKASSIENALLWFNHLHDFYQILAVRLNSSVNLLGQTSPMIISGAV
jgi:hypothetical protein